MKSLALRLIEKINNINEDVNCFKGLDPIGRYNPNRKRSPKRDAPRSIKVFAPIGYLKTINNILEDSDQLQNHIDEHYFREILISKANDKVQLCRAVRKMHNGKLHWCRLRNGGDNKKEQELFDILSRRDELENMDFQDTESEEYSLFRKLLDIWG